MLPLHLATLANCPCSIRLENCNKTKIKEVTSLLCWLTIYKALYIVTQHNRPLVTCYFMLFLLQFLSLYFRFQMPVAERTSYDLLLR